MSTESPLVNQTYLLEKFQGKGGWTYARIPEIAQDKQSPFGWVRVRGSIDGYPIEGYHLMPMGNGGLFLPVKSQIRKKIGKKDGDWVHVILYADNLPTEIPEELKLCLQDEPHAYESFVSQAAGKQKAAIDWIYSAKKEETKIERIVQLINQLAEDNKQSKN